MIELLSLLAGFASPFLGHLVGLASAWVNNKHELAMLQESNRSAREIATLNAQVGLVNAEVQDVQSARSTQPSYGVALLDAVKGGGWFERNVVMPFLVFALTVLEVVNGFMRPWVVYLISGMWASSKAAQFYFGYRAALGGGSTADEITAALAAAALAVWKDDDDVFMNYVVGFLLGSRHQLKQPAPR